MRPWRLALTVGSGEDRPMAKSPAFREEYARADEEYALVEAMVRARRAANLTQSELAARIGTTQSAIARLEAGYRRRSGPCAVMPKQPECG